MVKIRISELKIPAVAVAVISLWAVACWSFFQFAYKYTFFYQEQNQLFLMSWEHVETYFGKPAWLACVVGDFLTQFYYYLYAGATILTVSFLVLGDLTIRSLQKAGVRRGAYAIAVILMTVEALLCLNVEYRLSSVFALIGGAAMYLLYRRTLVWKKLMLPWCVVAAAFTFWMFGYGVWLFAALVITDMMMRHSKKMAVSVVLLFALLTAATPALKSIYMLDISRMLAYPGMGHFVKPALELQKEIAVDTEYYFGNYNKVESIVESCDNPTAHMKLYYNLVQAQYGMLPEKFMKYIPNEYGTFYAISDKTPIITVKDMNELYWLLGDMMFTERAAILGNVFSPGNRNVRMIKRLAQANLVSNDTVAAMKYLRLLRQTVAYRRYAEEIIKGNPKLCNVFQEKRKYINTTGNIRLSDNSHRIMQELLESNPKNVIARDYLLCSDLMLKDIETFKADYDRFCMEKKSVPSVTLYQQALCIYLAGTKAPQEEWERYIVRPDVFSEFSRYNERRGAPEFKDTYWYYYDTVNPKIKE